MNEKFLYRAKCIDSDRWVEGNLLIDTCGCFICADYCINNRKYKDGHYGYEIMEIRAFEIDPSTICRCTGLNDKNGKLICENDIVSFQFDNDDCPFPNKDTKKRIGKVFFSDFRASWSIAMGKNGSKSLNDDLWKYVQNGNRVEVIGSAIDNPELLE